MINKSKNTPLKDIKTLKEEAKDMLSAVKTSLHQDYQSSFLLTAVGSQLNKDYQQ